MEYRDDYYNKMPFYMAYPMQNLYLMEMEYEKDMERMKELYPREVQQIQQMVERRCDQMEYDGSRIYDENPDRMMLEEEVRRILEQFLRENPQYRDMRPDMPRPDMPRPDMSRPDMSRPDMPNPENMGPGMSQPRNNMVMSEYEDELSAQQRWGRETPWLRSLIGILFHDEIYRRRCRHRRCRRWW